MRELLGSNARLLEVVEEAADDSDGELVHELTVELAKPAEVELLERLGGSELGAPKPHRELLVLAPRDLVAHEHREELGVGELAVEGLAVAGFQRFQDAR